MQPQDIIRFWFEELQPKQHWAKDEALDRDIEERFALCHRAATQGELWAWRETREGRLAEIIVLDQFSRNMFRNHPESFAYDVLALLLAQEAVSRGVDQHLPAAQCSFLYMPYMHSESLAIHNEALKLFARPGLENNYDFELRHMEIIKQFGRYPHRNAILGRESTPEERAFLEKPGSSF